VHHCVLLNESLIFLAATMTKIIKEMLPPDVRVARDAQDLLIECCVGQNFIIINDNFVSMIWSLIC